MKWLFSICLLSLSLLAEGQFIIGAGMNIKSGPNTTLVTNLSINNQSTSTDLSQVNLVLASAANRTESFRTTGNPLSIRKLTINGGNYSILGDVTVTEELVFTSGNLIVDKVASAGTLTYKGAKDLEGSDKSYVNGRLFNQGSGLRTFPIGNAKGYFPVALENGDANLPLGFEVVASNPSTVGFAPSQTVKEVFPDHFWEFSVGGTGSFGGSIVSLSDNLTSNFFVADGDPIILEKEASANQKSLGGVINSPFISSAISMSAAGKYYALAKADIISVVIYKLITPDKDNKNDALYIQGIDAYPENEVTLLDRWGVVAANFKNFKNDQPENFKDLAIGNYICILKYKNGATEVNVKPQMITVLK
jgi:CHU_C Type IX secretion signal domain